MSNVDFLGELANEYQRLTSKGQQNFLDNFIKMPEGDGWVKVRLLPPLPGQRLPFCATRTHKMNNRNIHCPRCLNNATGKWLGECPICDYYNYLWREVDKKGNTDEGNALKAEARSIKPIERYYYNAIVRGGNPTTGQGPENGPLVLSIGKQLHTRILRAIVGDKEMDKEPLGNVMHPETGRDLKIVKKIVHAGTEAYPNYNESEFLGQSALGTSTQIEDWLSRMHDIMALRQLKPIDELKKEIRIFKGLEQDGKTAFDPSEYQVPSNKTSLNDSVAAVMNTASTVSGVSNEEIDLAEDLLNDPFIKELREGN